MKLMNVLSCLFVVLATACAADKSADATETAEASATSHTAYSCVIASSNSTVQSTPLWTEGFTYSAVDQGVNKQVGVTSPAATIYVTISRETNSLGERIDAQIYNKDTGSKAVTQVAEGVREIHLVYSQTEDDDIVLYCTAQ